MCRCSRSTPRTRSRRWPGHSLALPFLLLRAHAVAAADQADLAVAGLPILLAGVVGANLGATCGVLGAVRRPVEDYLRTR